MAKRTLTPEQRSAFEARKERNRHFLALIERRQQRDRELAAAEQRRERPN